MEIAGKTALVTGAGGGIGRVLVRRLAREGAAVVAVDIDGEAAAEVVAGVAEAASLQADVTRPNDVKRTIEHAERLGNGLAVLVNNAGGYTEPVFTEAPLEHWNRALDLNLRAVMLGVHFALPALKRRGEGAIVNIASTAGLGLAPHPGHEYAAAKAAVMRLTATLATLAKDGVRVNCVCPHTVATPAVLTEIEQARVAGHELPGPLKAKLLAPEEVADSVARFAKDDSIAGRVELLVGGREPELLPPGDAWY